MKKIIFLISVTFLLTTILFSQSRFNAGASFNIGIPTGSFSDIAKTGVGGSILGEYVVSNNLSLSLSVSYQNFPADFDRFAVGGKTYDLSINSIPVLLGIRYYFNQDYFGIVQSGVHFIRVSADVSSIYNKEKISTDYKAKIGLGTGLGFRHQLAEQSVLELSSIFNLVKDDFNSFLLRLSILILLDKL